MRFYTRCLLFLPLYLHILFLYADPCSCVRQSVSGEISILGSERGEDKHFHWWSFWLLVCVNFFIARILTPFCFFVRGRGLFFFHATIGWETSVERATNFGDT